MNTNYVVEEVSIDDIQPIENYRLKIKSDDLSELMSSIQSKGLLQSIGIRLLTDSEKELCKKQYKELSKKKQGDPKYTIVFGNRRYWACKKLGYTTIMARVYEYVDDETADEIQIKEIAMNVTENTQRKDINSYELGRAIYDLEQKGLSVEEAAVALSIPKSRAKTCIGVFKKTPKRYISKVKTMSFGASTKRSGEIPSTVAERIIMMERKYQLTSANILQLFDLAAKDDSMTYGKLNVIMSLLTQGIPFEKCIQQVEDIVVVRPSIPMYKEDFEKLKSSLGGAQGLAEMLYNSNIMKIKNPKICAKEYPKKAVATKDRRKITQKGEKEGK